MNHILSICLDEYVHSNTDDYMEKNLSFEDLRKITKFFFGWQGIVGDDLWRIYNSENKELVTKIPLLQSFINDCDNNKEIEILIRSLV